MNQPSLDDLMHKVDSRYTLVVLAAKRARVLTEKSEAQKDAAVDGRPARKPVTEALQEIIEDKIKFRRTKQGIK